MYQYSVEIEEVKVLHAVLLLLISFIVFCMVARKKLLSKRQYSNLLCLTCAVTFLYFMPMFMIARKTYALQGPDSEKGAKIFADWMYNLMKNNDENIIGLGFSCLVHVQIYIILFGMQWSTYGLRNTIRRLESLRDSGRGDYDS